MASSSEKQHTARGFVPPRNDDEKRLMRRVEELCRTAQQRGIPRYTDFLSDREQDLATAAMNRAGCAFGRFDGGYEQAERRVLCLEPPDAWQEAPVALIRVEAAPRQAGVEKLSHRDCLGALLGLGVERGCVGDILPHPQKPGVWYAFVQREKQDLFCDELSGVGRLAASAARCESLPQEALDGMQRQLSEATVPSLRADAVLAACMRTSRGAAAELIAAGKVEVNHVPLTAAHGDVYEGDILTVRGMGRFRLTEVGGKSKKERIFISFFKY